LKYGKEAGAVAQVSERVLLPLIAVPSVRLPFLRDAKEAICGERSKALQEPIFPYDQRDNLQFALSELGWVRRGRTNDEFETKNHSQEEALL